MTIIRIAAIMLVLFGIATEDRAAVAQAYPSKPVKLVVPYPPGGPNDIIARILAQKLAEGIGGTFFAENTVGAGGTIATGQAANAAAVSRKRSGRARPTWRSQGVRRAVFAGGRRTDVYFLGRLFSTWTQKA